MLALRWPSSTAWQHPLPSPGSRDAAVGSRGSHKPQPPWQSPAGGPASPPLTKAERSFRLLFRGGDANLQPSKEKKKIKGDNTR